MTYLQMKINNSFAEKISLHEFGEQLGRRRIIHFQDSFTDYDKGFICRDHVCTKLNHLLADWLSSIIFFYAIYLQIVLKYSSVKVISSLS